MATDGKISAKSRAMREPASDPESAMLPMEPSEDLDNFDMENYDPAPMPPLRKRDPQPGTPTSAGQVKVPTRKSIEGAASLFTKACTGGDAYKNNCAHFLSDAFIRAGYTELDPPSVKRTKVDTNFYKS